MDPRSNEASFSHMASSRRLLIILIHLGGPFGTQVDDFMEGFDSLNPTCAKGGGFFSIFYSFWSKSIYFTICGRLHLASLAHMFMIWLVFDLLLRSHVPKK